MFLAGNAPGCCNLKVSLPLLFSFPIGFSCVRYYLVSVYREDVFLLAVTTGEVQPLLVIEFLHRVFDIFAEYFGAVEESSIKENFSTVGH